MLVWHKRRAPRTASTRSLRPVLDPLENRRLLARALSIQDAYLVNSQGQSVSALDVGEQIFIRTDWTATGLTSADTYGVSFNVDGVTLNSATISGGGGDGGYNWRRGGWFAQVGIHTATIVVDPSQQVSGADETNTTFTFAFSTVEPTDLPGKFLNPMGTQPADWTIVNYVDVNPTSPSATDYRGGSYTYDGHTGMDLTIRNFADMDAGFPVLAALGGTVATVVDGNVDRNTAFTGSNANYVMVDNGNGWQTIYYHFLENSIAVQVGQNVSAGQMLGLVGSSGDSTDAHLHFEVQHNGDVVETNFDPSAYWSVPFTYEGDVPSYALGSGLSASDPSPDIKEGPTSVTTFPTSSNDDVWYWYRLSSLFPGAVTAVNWYRPDGTLATTLGFTSTSLQRYGAYPWKINSSVWHQQLGTWKVALVVNNAVLDQQVFNVTSGAGPAVARLALGATTAGNIVLNNRTTPIDFGTNSEVGDAPTQTFTLQNIGFATLNLGSPALPSGYSLVGTFPTSIAPGQAASFTVMLAINSPGTKFGAFSFTTNSPGQSLFSFNLTGKIIGVGPAGPVITLHDPAAVFVAGAGPVVLDRDATFIEYAPGSPLPSQLRVQTASGASSADQLLIASQGTGAGQIGLSGSNVTYAGVVIGAFSGGANLQPLVVSFNALATQTATQALIEAIAFQTASPSSTEPRYVQFSLTDTAGLSTLGTFTKTVEVNPGPPGITLSSTNLNLVEGGSVTVSVVPHTQPKSPLVLSFTDSGAGLVHLVSNSVMFTSSNWLTPQTITVTAANLKGGTGAGHIVISASTTDVNYANLVLPSLSYAIDSATNLVVTTQPPTTIAANTGFGLAVTAEDASNTIDTDFLGSVSASLVGSGSTLRGTLMANFVNGTATFSGLSITTIGNGYALQLNGGLLGSAITNSINVVAPAVSNTNTILTSSANLIVYGQAATFTANVAELAPGVAIPTGTVTFLDGITALGTVKLDSSGSAQFTTIGLTAGNHVIFAAYNGDSLNSSSANHANLIVNRAHLTVTASAASSSFTYGSALPSLSATISGFVNGDNALVVSGAAILGTAASATTGIGTYPVTITRGTLSATNYDFPTLNGGFVTVARAHLTVTANNASRNYKAPNPNFTATISGFVNGDAANVVSGIPTFSTTATGASTVGTYPINVSAGTLVAGNYDFTNLVSGVLTVNFAVPPLNDYTGAGHTDPALFRRTSAGTASWFVQGAPVLNGRSFGAGGLDVPIAADFDGDGKTDLVVYRPTTSQWFVQESSTNYSGQLLATFGGPTDVPVPADYNGNGKAVVAVYRPSTGQWFIQGQAAVMIITPKPGDIPVPGDFDNTGKAELALYRPSTAQWIISGPKGVHTISYGGLTDIPVPGAYNALDVGKSAVEPAVWRAATGQFFIDSPTGSHTYQFRIGDVPAPGDYDGMGETEAAVYRPSTGQWLVMAPNDKTPRVVATYGGNGDTPTASPYVDRALKSGGGVISKFSVEPLVTFDMGTSARSLITNAHASNRGPTLTQALRPARQWFASTPSKWVNTLTRPLVFPRTSGSSSF